jgi:CheY-like chemotaxis protein
MLKSVLIAEDDDSLRETLKAFFNRCFPEVVVLEAKNGLEAKKLLEASLKDGAEKFNLLITDVIMPEMDGHKLADFVRNTPELAGMPIIKMSGTFTNAELRKAVEQGYPVFQKPFKFSELDAVIADIFPS